MPGCSSRGGSRTARRSSSATPVRASPCCRTGACSSARRRRGRHRTPPLHAQNRYWHALGIEPLPWSARGITTPRTSPMRTCRECRRRPRDARQRSVLVVAVPPGLYARAAGPAGRHRQRVRRGRARPGRRRGRRLRDDRARAVPAAPRPAAAPGHGDAGRGLPRRRPAAPGALRTAARRRRARIQQAMAAAVATAFVRETRFDPLHEAATEQRCTTSCPAGSKPCATPRKSRRRSRSARPRIASRCTRAAAGRRGGAARQRHPAAACRRPDRPASRPHLCVSHARVGGARPAGPARPRCATAVVVELPAAAPAVGALLAARRDRAARRCDGAGAPAAARDGQPDSAEPRAGQCRRDRRRGADARAVPRPRVAGHGRAADARLVGRRARRAH